MGNTSTKALQLKEIKHEFLKLEEIVQIEPKNGFPNLLVRTCLYTFLDTFLRAQQEFAVLFSVQMELLLFCS